MTEVSPRVLIVEEEETLRRRLYGRLLDRDIFSDPVASGKHALDQLAERPYAVMVLDLSIRDIDVAQLLERVAVMPARPVVIAIASTENLRKLDTEVVQIVVRQPVRIGNLIDLIESCCRQAASTHSPVNTPGSAKKNGDRVPDA
jgi:DNA-binding NtrC family response regulator